MKIIKGIIFLTAFIILVYACGEDEKKYFDQNFVRFSLSVNKNGELDYKSANTLEVETYTHSTLNELKIPLVRSTENLNEELIVKLNTVISGSFKGIEINHLNEVIIPNGKVSDTIVISFNGLWTIQDEAKIQIKMISTNNPNVNVGWPRDQQKMDQLTIKLGSPKPIEFSFEKNLYEVDGNSDTILVPVLFSQVLPKSILEKIDIITAEAKKLSVCGLDGQNIKYSIIKALPESASNKILFKVILNQPLDQNSKLNLTLNGSSSGFKNGSILLTSIIRSTVQKSSEDPAQNWYDLSDGFYRTYGKAWYFDPVSQSCKWSTFNTFTKPVFVARGSSVSNSSGFHRFRIGFLGNNRPVGTNPFDFRRYYSGPSVESPGYNIDQAIELIPDGSSNGGTIRVIPQTLTFIKASNVELIEIPICGSGTYTYDAEKKRWEMFIELVSDETQLGKSSKVIRYMYLYNKNLDGSNPRDLTLPCIPRYDL
jgi:hypothetical protein